jgi:hypothetical protein
MRFGRDLAVPALAVLIGCNAATSSNEQRLANDGPRATNPATIAAEVAEAPASLEQPPSVEVDVFGTVITSKRLDEAYGLLVWEQIQRDQDEMSDMGRRLAMVRERMSQDAVVLLGQVSDPTLPSGAEEFETTITVLAGLSGSVASDTITLVQHGPDGALGDCGVFKGKLDERYALVLEPMADGRFTLVTDRFGREGWYWELPDGQLLGDRGSHFSMQDLIAAMGAN